MSSTQFSNTTHHKAPSAGTKVEPGGTAPTRSEPTGPVPPDSLAAESARSGGQFASNTAGGVAQPPAHSTGAGSAPGSGTPSIPDQAAGAAPTYVNNPYIRDPKGPHGKNISEGFDDANTKDGVEQAFKAEVGSKNDPSRAAEQHLNLSQIRGGRDAGPRQTRISGQTASGYEKLDSDIQA